MCYLRFTAWRSHSRSVVWACFPFFLSKSSTCLFPCPLPSLSQRASFPSSLSSDPLLCVCAQEMGLTGESVQGIGLA